MRIEVHYEAPEADVIDLTEAEEELWLEHTHAYGRGLEIYRKTRQVAGAASAEYAKAERALDDLLCLIEGRLNYPDLEVSEVIGFCK